MAERSGGGRFTENIDDLLFKHVFLRYNQISDSTIEFYAQKYIGFDSLVM